MIDRNARPTVDAALAVVRAHAPLLPGERIALADAGGRVLAEAPRAILAVPRFDTSAMDGFALNSVDTLTASTEAPASLTLLDRYVAAGTKAEKLPRRSACRIATGAPIPDGADAVLPNERARAGLGQQGLLTLFEPVAPGHNIRSTGEDVAVGASLLAPGAMVTPAAVGLMAAAGIHEVITRRMPRVRLISTGNELIAGQNRSDQPSHIPDSNGPMLAAALRELGITACTAVHASDDRVELRAAFADDAADLVISTGGVSVGERDLIPAVLGELGATIHFNGVAMRPGKPILFATLPDNRPFFGLPGNPVAALAGFRFFVTACVRAMLGVGAETGIALSDPIPRRADTTLFLRGKLRHDAAGVVHVDLMADQRSHILSSTAASDCWVRADADARTPARIFPQHSSL